MRQNSQRLLGVAAIAVFLSCPLPALADEYSQGTDSYAAGNFIKAKEHFAKAVVAKPKSWQTHYQLANTFVQLKDSANAKKSYIKCLASNPPADIRANCERAVAYIASNPTLAAPAAAPPVYRPSMYTSGTRSTSASSSTGSPEPNDKLEEQRSRIMQEAEAQIVKMRAEEDLRLKEMEANANQMWLYPDGSVRNGLSNEEEAAFKKEVEQKAAAIKANARRRADNIR